MRYDFDKVLADPAAVFATPAAVLRCSDYSAEQKRQVLRRWLHDAEELAVAEDEGMAGGEPSLIEQVRAALAELERAV